MLIRAALPVWVLAVLGPGCQDTTLGLKRTVAGSGGDVSVGGATGGAVPGDGGGSGGAVPAEVGGAVSVGGKASGGDHHSLGGSPENMAGSGPGDGCPDEFDCSVPVKCPGWLEHCGNCSGPADCPFDQTCDTLLYRCVPRCSPSLDCPASHAYCDEFRGSCSECGYGHPCQRGFQCVIGLCVPCSKLSWCEDPDKSMKADAGPP